MLWPLGIYWVVFFVACYVVVEVGQDQLYDEVTPYVGWKVAGGSLILAMFATVLKPSYETFLTSEIHWTALQGLAWFLVFMFILQFHPWHALAAGLVTMILVMGLATLGVDTFMKPKSTPAPVRARGSEPIRGTLSPVAPKAAK
jgi:FtsH-binding integral membrane protein